MKKEKSKACKHTTSFYDSRLGYIRCQFCGRQVVEVSLGPAKTKNVAVGPKTPATKMGFEKQDPRIKQAEVLKRRLTGVDLALKRSTDQAERRQLAQERKALQAEMKGLQSSYED